MIEQILSRDTHTRTNPDGFTIRTEWLDSHCSYMVTVSKDGKEAREYCDESPGAKGAAIGYCLDKLKAKLK